MQIVIDLDERIYNICKGAYKKGCKDKDTGVLAKAIGEGTILPDKATNGQMMEQTFPGMVIKYIGFSAVVITTDDSGMEQEFSREWWDAPYNRKEN